MEDARTTINSQALAMSSHLSSLLRNSRLSQLYQTDKAILDSVRNLAPTHQVIETKPATQYRQEWGLKSSIPSKIKSRYIVVNKLDTLERFTSFEPVGQYQWNRIRFQEIGVAPSYGHQVPNPLFSGASQNASSDKLSGLLGISEKTSAAKRDMVMKKLAGLYPAYMKWISEKYPEIAKKPHEYRNASYLREFLSQYSFDKPLSGQFKVVGTGGLSYALQGRLRQSPRGVQNKNPATGRVLQLKGMERTAAVGGFVANLNALGRVSRKLDIQHGDYIRAEKYPFFISEAKVGENGKITMEAQLLETNAVRMVDNSIAMPSKKRLYNKSEGQQQKIDPEKSATQAAELLSILTNFAR
ncbi:HCL533Wp [Eremothecium sinecaudum]|uniref:HCL533Wp n=1 Tax=Eremothecium sinecaudum TaxID=45286 RepID=A0A109UY07_9SACH|nr:HCL533Wp [Eremothecium sinecaudum]AMD19618.1 HCL533Wp [Eremothecium sinecaudum]